MTKLRSFSTQSIMQPTTLRRLTELLFQTRIPHSLAVSPTKDLLQNLSPFTCTRKMISHRSDQNLQGKVVLDSFSPPPEICALPSSISSCLPRSFFWPFYAEEELASTTIVVKAGARRARRINRRSKEVLWKDWLLKI